MADKPNPSPLADTHSTQAGQPKKDGRLSMWIAMISAAGAVAASIVASVQVHEASQQNIVSEQQQLLQLTTSIAQQYANHTSVVDQAAGTLTGLARTSAQSSADVGWTNQLLAEGEAGAVLISDLNGKGVVASIEYTEVANALVTGEAYAQAIEYYHDAVNAPPKAPLTQADALRSEGTVYYDLGEPAAGHALMMQAASVYNEYKDLTRFAIADGVGQSFAEDSWNEMEAGNCKVGLAEIADALARLAPADGGDAEDQVWLSSDLTALKQYCSSSSANASNNATPTASCTFLYGRVMTCSSRNPQVVIDFLNISNDTGCIFNDELNWNDGSALQGIAIPGGPAGPHFLASHAYKNPGTYSIRVTGTPSAGCEVFPTTFDFTLLRN